MSARDWNHWIRQTHRWTSMLPALALLSFSGLYLFGLPYIAKRRMGAGRP